MMQPSRHSPREIIGDAAKLIGPYLAINNFALDWNLRIDYPNGDSYPISQIARQGSKLEVFINLPGLYLASLAWAQGDWIPNDSSAEVIIAKEILSSVERGDHHFLELAYLSNNQEDHEKNLGLTCALSVVRPFGMPPYIGHLSVRYSIPEKQSLLAAPRIARSLKDILEFAVFQGTERAIEAMVDRAVRLGGVLDFPAVNIPVSETLNRVEVLDQSLPSIIRPYDLAAGGSLGEQRPLVQFYVNRLVVRIPCLKIPEDRLSFVLNENSFAKTAGIVTSYVDLPNKNPSIAGLIDELASKFSTEDSAHTPSRSRRPEPGYWRIEVPHAPKDTVPALRNAIQYLTTFREALRRAKLHLPL